MLLDKSGSKIQGYLYTPFGEIWASEEPESSLTEEITRKFSGHYFDKESGLYYMNARYYDPDIGMFMRPDPAMDGLNHYAYANCNPIKYSDPTGCDTWLDAANNHLAEIIWNSIASCGVSMIIEPLCIYFNIQNPGANGGGGPSIEGGGSVSIGSGGSNRANANTSNSPITTQSSSDECDSSDYGSDISEATDSNFNSDSYNNNAKDIFNYGSQYKSGINSDDLLSYTTQIAMEKYKYEKGFETMDKGGITPTGDEVYFVLAVKMMPKVISGAEQVKDLITYQVIKVQNWFTVGGGSTIITKLYNRLAGSNAPNVIPNDLKHIFGNPGHNLGNFLNNYGGNQTKAYEAIWKATQNHVIQNEITGIFEQAVDVGGTIIIVRGNVIDGFVKIGTAFIEKGKI